MADKKDKATERKPEPVEAAAPAPVEAPASVESDRSTWPRDEQQTWFQNERAMDLLARTCQVFGINPSTQVRPLELMGWRVVPEDRLEDRPMAVVVKTYGGKKLVWYEDEDYPMDQDTEERLADIFNAYSIDPTTKLKVRRNLPEDLTLPRQFVTGYSAAQKYGDHVYKKGYLQEGGRTEAGRRERARTAAAAKR